MDAPAEPVIELTPAEEKQLLQVARTTLETAVHTGLEEEEPALPPLEFSERLLEEGASFVTVRVDGALRGCVGSPRPRGSLVMDVARNATRAALTDPRFKPIGPDELPGVEIEISILTEPAAIRYDDSTDLISRIRPCIDGVLIVHGFQRALLLPQTWDRFCDPADFMAVLCQKAGLHADAWLGGELDVYTFQVHTISE